jgi:uncharacterized repeat protein (TIGR01451 family)
MVVAVPSVGLGFSAQYGTGNGFFDYSYSVAVGDFNNDGKADLVVTDLSSSSLAVLLGSGDGTFRPGVSYDAGLNPTSIAVGDFNGDGKMDLAVGNATGETNNGVCVLLGNGDGTFQTAVNYPTGADVYSVAVGDFNEDGLADLVVANGGSNTVSILLGKGDGTFQAPVNYAIPNPQSIAVGDFNKDGKADLAVGLYYTNQVSVMLGNGDGTFQSGVNYGTGQEPTAVVVADLNGDGAPDIALSDQNSNDVSILLGNGDGTFKNMVSYAVGDGPGSLAVIDLNGDGRPDLAFGGLGGNLTVLLGSGDGSFGMPLKFQTGSNLWPVVAGDFNGDGKADLAVGKYVGGVFIFLGSLLETSTTTLVQPNTMPYGQPVVLTATVAPGGIIFSPSGLAGTVQFRDGSTILGTGNVINGTATFTAAGLASGAHSLFADYLGGSDASPSTSLASTLIVTGGPTWNITKNHTGNFIQGKPIAYTITVSNTGAVPTNGTVTVTDMPPTGLSVTSMSGQGWTCAGLTCTRTDGLIQAFSYPSITVSATIAANAQTPLTNVATVFGGGAVAATASDQAIVESSSSPFGYIDTPVNNSTGIAGAVGVTGWALSGVGVETVAIWREPVTNENPNSLIFIGTAEIIVGSRPDVAMTYPGYPDNTSGWGYQILTNELPNSNGQAGTGNGTYHLHVLVTDNANTVADIGSTTITVNNAGSALPFGTIDTPTQGGTVSGTIVNFGWVLTPQPNLIPIDGSTIRVFIDNVAVGHPVYNNYRTDIATLFPDYQNSQGAVGYYYIDTTQLTNGLHTISWVARDSAGNAQGLGSRYFNVQN